MQSLSKPELLALLKAAQDYSERDRLMILVAYWHGLRASEVVGLTTTSIADGYLTVQRLKGSNKTVQPLIEHSDPLLNERGPLQEFARFKLRGERLFPVHRQTFWALFQRHGKTAGLPAHLRHPHCAKHTAARHLIAKIGIHETQTWLGHKSLSSTGEYLKVSDQMAAQAVLAAID